MAGLSFFRPPSGPDLGGGVGPALGGCIVCCLVCSVLEVVNAAALGRVISGAGLLE